MKQLASLKGSSYQPGQVTDEELQDKLDELKTGMLMAFNYAQGTEQKSQIFIIIAFCYGLFIFTHPDSDSNPNSDPVPVVAS